MRKHGRNTSQPQGLELFFAMYAVGLVLGIEQISQALYGDLRRQLVGQFRADFILDVGLFVAILLLIARFFWSTGNIRRALQRDRTKSDARYLIFHLPVLLVQGVFVLFVCFSFVDYIDAKVSEAAVIMWFLVATFWNAVWLASLLTPRWQMPESFWALNNIVFVVVAGGLLVLNRFSWATPREMLSAFVALSVFSSLLDLTKTANSYLSEGGR